MEDAQRDCEPDVVFVGQTGVGKSTLINMIIGRALADVSNDAHPCTTHTAEYSASLGPGLRCRLWDTRGLDEAAGIQGFIAKLRDKIRQRLASQQTRELKETLRGLDTPILIWCIDATKVDVDVHWQQFHRVFVEYCERKATPAIVITRGPPRAGWETRCAHRLPQLDLGVDVPLRMVRRYSSPTSSEYQEDSEALKSLISEIITRPCR